MNGPEMGFLLLSGRLGDPTRKPLTPAQLRRLLARVRSASLTGKLGDLTPGDLQAMGYSGDDAARIAALLDSRELLERYLFMARAHDCVPLSRASDRYPARVTRALGDDSPGCIWAKGDLRLLENPAVALVGSRDLTWENSEFAWEAGRQAALQGYTLVSGGARGADSAAQEGCLGAGGSVICVLPRKLDSCAARKRVLYLSEDGYDEDFSPRRALSRNRIIHCLGQITLVAQATYGKGGTWDGSIHNLKGGWSKLCCLDDGSAASNALHNMGAALIRPDALQNLSALITE